MGCCLSKKNGCCSSNATAAAAAGSTVTGSAAAAADPGNSGNKPTMKLEVTNTKTNNKAVKKQVQEEEEEADLGLVKKEIFVIKHRKSHHETPDKRSPPQSLIADADATTKASPAEMANDITITTAAAAAVATNSNNGNSNIVMPRTSSCTKDEVDAILIQCGRLSRSNSSGSGARKYSGSKRSYDFDHDADDQTTHKSKDDDDDKDERTQHQQRHRHRQSSRPSPSSPGRRRRTPSREREQQQLSCSTRERSSGSGSRRVSRSPGRRSETSQQPSTNTNASNRPAKMVSVPATVSSSLATEPQTTTVVKRIAVKRNAGDARGAASPRSQSPARTNANQQQQPPSLSRSSSRKAEQSPCRRNPLSEIDTNSLAYAQPMANRTNTRNKQVEGQVQPVKQSVNVHSQTPVKKPNTERYNRVNNCTGSLDNKVAEEETQATIMAANFAESLKVQTQALTRSRSGRRSRDLDANPSYTALLLEDIQNFHQKNTPSFSLPACVTKACSILEAVADLNSTTSSTPSERPANVDGKKLSDTAFVESEVLAGDDLMEPSLHRYVTVRRGGVGTLFREDMDDDDGQESSGSNSFVGGGGGGRGFSASSSWEPNSADSTSRSMAAREEYDEKKSPLGFQSHESARGFSGQRAGIGRRRAVGDTDKALHTNLIAAATATAST